MQELELKNGAHIRVRPVPPHVIIQFNQGVTKTLPPEPKPPRKRVTMADGHVEEDTVTDGPVWDEYERKRDEWQAACDAHIVDANDQYNVLQRDFAVIEWSFDGEHWQRDVPPAWEFPPALERNNVFPCGNWRVDFIGIELLTTPEDWAAVRDVAEGVTANITDEEAAQVRAGFQAGDRRARDTSPVKVGWIRRLALKISRGNASGQGVEPDA